MVPLGWQPSQICLIGSRALPTLSIIVFLYMCAGTSSKLLTEALCTTKQAKSAKLSTVAVEQHGQVPGGLIDNSSRMLLQCTVYPGPTGDSR